MTARPERLRKSCLCLYRLKSYDISAGRLRVRLRLEGLEIGGSAHNPFGLKTRNVDYTAEAKCRVPVVSSTPHALMNAVRLVGLSPRAVGYGSVLTKV
jgi:hypothetical protein